MSRLCALAMIAAFISPVSGQPTATTADLAFLTGCWKFERNGRTVEEHWLAPAGGSLLGVSRTVAGGKIVEFEFLQLRDLPDRLAAEGADVSRATFKLTTKAADEILIENPQHDFPQRIRYRPSGDTLHARVEGTLNGKPRAIDFPYARVSCMP